MLKIIHTIYHLRLSQLYFLFVRRYLPSRGAGPLGKATLSDDFALAPPIPVSDASSLPFSFRFVGVEQVYSEGAVDWSADSVSMLWRFNLHYFDYLRDPQRSVEERRALITDWMKNATCENTVAWDPFTASLRAVNWIFCASASAQSMPHGYSESLFQQLLFVEKNDERELLANHYLENLKALLFGGVYFGGATADRWRKRAIRDLSFELKEQTLQDGGHFERSPQYHCLMLENYLDIYNLVLNNASCFESHFLELVRSTVQASISWLERVVFPDGHIPLFNDAAFGVAPTLAMLQEYAGRLGGISIEKELRNEVIDLPQTGLYGTRVGQDMVVMDCGDIGPRYQPGHTHCDFLSYELMHAGRRVVVDTGVSEYKPGEMRHYLRSTEAHNTVRVDGQEQSEIWGEFRVGRRAKKVSASVVEEQSEEGRSVGILGEYEGFFPGSWSPFPNNRIIRKMDVKLHEDGIRSVHIVDTIRGRTDRVKTVELVESFIHFHPDLSLTALEGFPTLAEGSSSLAEGSPVLGEEVLGLFRRFSIAQGDEVIGSLWLPKELHCELRDSVYCPEFGKELPAKKVVLSRSGDKGALELPVQMSYAITFDDFQP